MAHWLRRMLAPESIAIVGASERDGSLAAFTHRQLMTSGYAGSIYSDVVGKTRNGDGM